MPADAPTTLHIPAAQAPAGTDPVFSPSGLSSVWWLLIAIPALLVLLWGSRAAHKRRQLRPEERAFYALARRMGLRGDQVDGVRRFAQQSGGREPLEVLMNEHMLARALESSP